MITCRLYWTLFKLGRNSHPYIYLRRATSTTADVGNRTPLSSDIRPFSEIPGPKGLYDIPFLGIALNFKPFGKHDPGDVHFVVEDMIKIYGDIFKMRFGREYMVYINDPTDAKSVFLAKYEEHKRLQPELAVITAERTHIPRGLAILNGQEWIDRRKPSQEKLLRPTVVANYVPLIEKVTNDLVEDLRGKQDIDDLLWTMTNYSTESVGMLCFNKRLGCLTSRKDNPADVAEYIATLFDCIQKSIFSPNKGYMYFRTPLYKRYETSALKLSKLVSKEIKEQRTFLKTMEKEGKLEEYLEKEPNFMYSLLADDRISDDHVNSLISDLFGAGIDSTANTLVFLLGHLALNPDKQENLYREIQRVTGDSATLTKQHLAQMSYLKACLRESMRRIFPTPFGSVRIPESDIVVGGYQIPTNTMIIINNRSICNDERFFPNPDKFLPERWLRETKGDLATSKEHIFAHKPFGFGPRSCVGQRFAENEIFIATAKIIKNFKLSMAPEIKEIPYHIRIFTAPVDKVQMTFTKR